jgi:hypothetical protein
MLISGPYAARVYYLGNRLFFAMVRHFISSKRVAQVLIDRDLLHITLQAAEEKIS